MYVYSLYTSRVHRTTSSQTVAFTSRGDQNRMATQRGSLMVWSSCWASVGCVWVGWLVFTVQWRFARKREPLLNGEPRERYKGWCDALHCGLDVCIKPFLVLFILCERFWVGCAWGCFGENVRRYICCFTYILREHRIYIFLKSMVWVTFGEIYGRKGDSDDF